MAEGNGTTAGFEAFGTFSTARTINLGNTTVANNVILVAAKRLSLREAIPAIRRIRDFGRGGVTPSFKRVTTCRKSDDM